MGANIFFFTELLNGLSAFLAAINELGVSL
jgi:hypothetical protein